jgi:paraquat-inducible protein A
MTTRVAPIASPPGAAAPENGYLVCEECDAVYPGQSVASDAVLRCRRCGATLARGHGLPLDGQLALTLAALVVFAIASLSPIVTLELRGQRSVVTLLEAVRATWDDGDQLLALLAAGTAGGFPLAVIALRLWVLVPLWTGRPLPGFIAAMRALLWVLRWSMVEVFMLAILVAVVRSAGVTPVVPGPGIFAYGALVLLLAAIQSSGLHGLWRLVEGRPA